MNLPDWISIAADHRLSYWDGHAKGVGQRVQRRNKSREDADAMARRLVEEAGRSAGLDVAHGATWTDLCQAWVTAHDGRINEGTLRRRISSIDCWVVPNVGATPLDQSGLQTLTKVTDAVVSAERGVSTLDSAVQTLGVIAAWGRGRAWLPANPLGLEGDRRIQLKHARASIRFNSQRHAQNDGDADRGVSMEMVPTWTQVCDFADAVADRAGGLYRSRRTGERLGAGIRVSAGSGLRLCELLGLVPFEVNLDRGLITVRHQLDRYRAWRPGEPMPTSLPKHHNPKRGFRSAVLWELVRDDVGRLLHDSGEGPLLPPPPNVTWWADGWGRLLKASADDIGWRWPPHYLRHHYGSYCLAPVESGGRGMTAVEVQHSLGHTKLSTTLDTYVQQTAEPGGWV